MAEIFLRWSHLLRTCHSHTRGGAARGSAACSGGILPANWIFVFCTIILAIFPRGRSQIWGRFYYLLHFVLYYFMHQRRS